MATWKPSPNYAIGRIAKIDRVILHWIVGNLASADATFANPKSGVSAHYAIEGNKVHQYVRESDTAFHAGTYPMNSRSIGIEHSAQPGRDAAPSTLESSAKLLAQISERHSIPLDRKHVLKHSEVVPTQCPGTIPIDSIIKRANELLKGDDMVTRDVMAVITRAFNGRSLVADDLKQEGKITAQAYLQRAMGQKTAQDAVKRAQQPADFGDFLMERYRPSNGEFVALLAQENGELTKKVKDLKAELAVQSDDTKNLNALGVSLRWLISRLGIK